MINEHIETEIDVEFEVINVGIDPLQLPPEFGCGPAFTNCGC